MLPPTFVADLEAIVGAEHVLTEGDALIQYGTDALKRGHPAEVVVKPANTKEVAEVVQQCAAHCVPFLPRGAGTGYTGGAVPLRGGVVISLERMNRILEIDAGNLIAVVEPCVITGDLQDAVERVGLFYPPDPASLKQSTIGGNVAECAGGPRAFKYGTTKHFVLGLQAVLPNGEVIETGGKVVKNVVGYDLTQLLVGSEGTLAVITRIVLRLVPKPPSQVTLRATFPDVGQATSAVTGIVAQRVVPAAVELVDGESLRALAQYLELPALAPAGVNAVLIVEVDGTPAATAEEAERVAAACRDAGASEVLTATTTADRDELWRVRRELSYSLKMIAALKFNHDVVVPKARIPELFALVERIRAAYSLRIPCFGHAGDGNIHVNIMVSPDDADEVGRVKEAEQVLFEGIVALEGAISGEHGIGFSKAPYLPLQLSPEEISLMKRVKDAFDPHNLLNPGKIFPE